MYYSKDSHRFNKNMRFVSSGCCYVKVATEAKNWKPSFLMKLVHGRGWLNQNNIYERLLDGAGLNSPINIREINKKFPNIDILSCRDQPFFKLFTNNLSLIRNRIDEAIRSTEFSNNSIDVLLEQNRDKITSPLHKILLERRHSLEQFCEDERPGQFKNTFTSPEYMSCIGEFCNYDALIILTAWTKEAELQQLTEQWFDCVRKTKAIFPHVVSSTPQLFMTWERLYLAFEQFIWRPPNYFTSLEKQKTQSLTRSELYLLIDKVAALERKALNEGIELPPNEYRRKLSKSDFYKKLKAIYRKLS